MNPSTKAHPSSCVPMRPRMSLSAACTAACATAALAGAVPAALAQSFPSRPVRMIVGFPPGGATDLVARILQPKLADAFGQQVVVDNRPGANGVISLEILSRSDADGHSVAFGHIGNLVISPTIQKVPYDPYKSFEPIGMMVTLQNIMIVHPSVQAKSLKELIALAKAKPGTINYATSGIGSPGHLATVLFETMTGTSLSHVPYKGGGPALTDLIGGQVPMFTAVISTAVPQVQAGKARALAVTGARRSDALPDVPTVAEAGVPGYQATNWYGLVAPAKTPKAAITRFHKDMVAALNAADVRQQLKDRGIEAAPGTPEEFTRFVRDEEKRWGPIIRKGKFE
ncbi:MAG: Bug family tripartite tricarboxylate transporter substrate binding protein [bacterium]|nr:tripartite tricarboxylate transporter substrate binding protein [Betaproteobacteria bacterium]